MGTLSLPLLNKDDRRFQLKVENRLKNIFVTQLEDHGYEFILYTKVNKGKITELLLSEL